MSTKSKEYIAIKNLLHNELGLTKDQIREIVIEVMRDEARIAAKRILQLDETTFKQSVDDQVKKQVTQMLSGGIYSSGSRDLMQAIGSAIVKQIKVEIKH